MPESLNRIFQLVLDNISWIIFGIFMLSGFFSKSGGKKTSSTDPVQTAPRASNPDERPLVERMAEHFGIPLEELQGTPGQNPKPQPAGQAQAAPQSAFEEQPREERYASDSKHTSLFDNQEEFPDPFSGKTIWDEKPADDGYTHDDSKWGFDDSEWGGSFAGNSSQWGHTFPEKKDSEPRVEVAG